jgi:hypothetical protein
MNKAVRGFFLPCLFLFFAGCTDNQHEPEKKAEVSGVFSTKSDDSLSIFVSELRRSDLGAGYRIEYSRDHGYRGEYLEFSHDGHVVIDAMKIPMEKAEYAISIYDMSQLPPGHADIIYKSLGSAFGPAILEGRGVHQ